MTRQRAMVMVGIVCALLMVHPMQAQQPAEQPTQVPTTEVPGTIPQPKPGGPSQTVVPVTNVSSPAAPANPMDQVMWALAMSYVLQFVKKSKWFSFITPLSSARVQAFWGFIVAAATAGGIHFVVNGSFFSHDGIAYSLSGLSFDGIKDIGFQWASQQGWYDLVVKKPAA